jgi:ribosomal protein S25
LSRSLKKNKYNYRKARQEERWVQLSLQKTEQAAMMIEKQGLRAVLEKFQSTQILTPELIDKLTEMIDVHSDNRIYVGCKDA